MSLAREEIVKGMKDILGEDRVITDEPVLKESSNDRYRKFEQVPRGLHSAHPCCGSLCKEHRGGQQGSEVRK